MMFVRIIGKAKRKIFFRCNAVGDLPPQPSSGLATRVHLRHLGTFIRHLVFPFNQASLIRYSIRKKYCSEQTVRDKTPSEAFSPILKRTGYKCLL